MSASRDTDSESFLPLKEMRFELKEFDEAVVEVDGLIADPLDVALRYLAQGEAQGWVGDMVDVGESLVEPVDLLRLRRIARRPELVPGDTVLEGFGFLFRGSKLDRHGCPLRAHCARPRGPDQWRAA